MKNTSERLAVLETQMSAVCDDIRDMRGEVHEIRNLVQKLTLMQVRAASDDVTELYDTHIPAPQYMRPDTEEVPTTPTVPQLLWKWGFWGATALVLSLSLAKLVGVF